MRTARIWAALVVAAAVAAPFFLYERALHMDFQRMLEAPSAAHWFGTDSLGRDILSRLLCGASVSVGVSVGAVLIALTVGVLFGAVAGYFGGWVDRAVMAFVDVMLCFPSFFLMLAVIAVLGPDIRNLVIVLALTGWMGTARLVRAEILSLREREFVLASKALGGGPAWVIYRHLLPNAMGPVIVNAVLGISAAMLAEGGLSFLGIGVQPPVPSWGNMLMDGKATLGVAWWVSFFPGLMIFLTSLSVYAIGEEMRRGCS